MMLLFMLLSAGLGAVLYFKKCPKCPEITNVNKFIQADTLEPVAIIAIPDDKFDTLFTVTPTKPKKKPSLTQRITKRHNYHKVKKGENLYRIGLKYGVPYSFLMEINKLKSVDIKAGQWIYLGTEDDRQNYLTKYKADSLYIYNTRYGDSLAWAEVYTESLGPIVNQAVEINFRQETPKIRFGIGVQLNTLSAFPYEVKGGILNKNILYTGGVIIGEKTGVSVGIIKLLK